MCMLHICYVYVIFMLYAGYKFESTSVYKKDSKFVMHVYNYAIYTSTYAVLMFKIILISG